MNFLQFFIWGSWLLTIGAYWFQTRKWSGTDFGAIFSTMACTETHRTARFSHEHGKPDVCQRLARSAQQTGRA